MKNKLFLFCVLLLAAAYAFCTGSQQGQSASGGGASAYPTGVVSYPIKTDVTVTYWAAMNTNLSPNYANYSEIPFYQGLIERTGIKMTFLHPPSGTAANEQLNLMIAAADLPDIIMHDILNLYPGGPEKAISDGVILRLNDLISNYAPNLKGVLANPTYDRMVKTDNGSYFCFPNIREEPWLGIWQGIQVRKDWLDELGLQPPVTYDDWHAVLTAFKTRKNSPAPLSIPYNNASFMYGYGLDRDFFLGDDGKVTWGRVLPAYRDYLTMMAQWYREGLLDPDTATLTSQNITTRITGGTSGATHGAVLSNMSNWFPPGKAANPNFDLLGVKAPVRRNGDALNIINIDNQFSGANGTLSVAKTTKYPEVVARLLDYGYGREGYLYHNYGAEGVSYTMVNGVPTYTDLIFHNPNGWPVGQTLASYQMSSYGGPHLQAPGWQSSLSYPQQREAIANWTIDEPFKHKLPPITPTPEESQEMARIMNEVNTYANEMMVKYILGTEPLSSFDTYVSTIRRMGIDRAIAIQNAALARFYAR